MSMEMIDNKKIQAYCHSSLADVPKKTAKQMKEFMDAMPTKVLIPKINEIVDLINSGLDGKSAYEIALDHGFVGSEEQWLASLRGEKGETGDYADGTRFIPDYIKEHAKEVAVKLENHQSGNSCCFAFLTDAHVTASRDYTVEAATHAGKAIKEIHKLMPLDFIVHGGDYTWGAASETKEDTYDDFKLYNELIGSAVTDIPNIYTIGNHDDMPYQATENRLTQSETFGAIGRKNRLANAVCNAGCNYGYVDFDSQKVRVIYVDTDDMRSLPSPDSTTDATGQLFLNYHNVSKEQLDFIAYKALDFSDKPDYEQWCIVVVSHMPIGGGADRWKYMAEEGNAGFRCVLYAVSGVLDAYQHGTSFSYDAGVYNDGVYGLVGATYNFENTVNRVQDIVAIHGDQHNFQFEKLERKIWSIGCPNIVDGRELVSDDGNKYTKVPGTKNGTSFCIFTIDRENRVIYSDCYGAGIDQYWYM